MSELADYIRNVVEGYIDGEIDVDSFRQHFVGAYVHARNSAPQDRVANGLASKLMLPYAEFSAGHRSEDSLRRRLDEIMRPFVTPRVLVQVVFDLSHDKETRLKTRAAVRAQRIPIEAAA
jgi:hypothetical protein